VTGEPSGPESRAGGDNQGYGADNRPGSALVRGDVFWRPTGNNSSAVFLPRAPYARSSTRQWKRCLAWILGCRGLPGPAHVTCSTSAVARAQYVRPTARTAPTSALNRFFRRSTPKEYILAEPAQNPESTSDQSNSYYWRRAARNTGSGQDWRPKRVSRRSWLKRHEIPSSLSEALPAR
jgi:hypothetical protein